MPGAKSGPWAPGGSGGPGRPKGSINRKTLELRERIQTFMSKEYGKEEYCPILANLERVYSPDSTLTEVAKIDVRFRVADFIYPKPKAVEISSGEGGVEVRMSVAEELLKLMAGKLD